MNVRTHPAPVIRQTEARQYLVNRSRQNRVLLSTGPEREAPFASKRAGRELTLRANEGVIVELV